MNQKRQVEKPVDSLEELAAAWLQAERRVAAQTGVPAQAEAEARRLSALYDDAIRAATQEEFRIAWESARKIQSDTEMGSKTWAEARHVSELLRREYLSRQPDAAPAAGAGAD